MARKRIIDPEFWSDEEISHWSYAARLFYIGLWNFADDAGRFKAHNDLLKAQVFPYDKKINIDGLKKELNHKIQWYEVEGCQYGFIRNFLKYQRIDRPTDSKLPKPPPFVEPSSSPLRALVPNISKDNISKGPPADSVTIYTHYAKTIKDGAKEDALKSISKLLKSGVAKDDLLARIDAYKTKLAKEGTEPKYYIQANNFFGKAARWKDFEPVKQKYKPADPNCKLCNGTGWKYIEAENANAKCDCTIIK